MRRALTKQFYSTMALAGAVKFFNSCLNFAPPLLLFGLLDNISSRAGNPAVPAWPGYLYAVGIYLTMSLRTLTENNYFHRVVRCGFQIRVALTTSVYRKALRMSPTARVETPTGQIVNLMQLDATRLDQTMLQLNVIWDAPFQIAGYMILLGFFVGYSALAGLSSMLLLIPLNGVAMMQMGRHRRAVTVENDKRIKITNEILAGIKAVKLYAYENAVAAIIGKIRDAELAAIKSYFVVSAVNTTLMMVAPTIVAVITLLCFAGTGGDFSPSRVFAALAVLSLLRFPLMFFPAVISQLADAKVSLERLDRYFSMPEVEGFGGASLEEGAEADTAADAIVAAVEARGAATVAMAADTHDTSSPLSVAASATPTIDESSSSSRGLLNRHSSSSTSMPSTSPAAAAADSIEVPVADATLPASACDAAAVAGGSEPNLAPAAAAGAAISIRHATFQWEDPVVKAKRLAAKAAAEAAAAAKKQKQQKRKADPSTGKGPSTDVRAPVTVVVAADAHNKQTGGGAVADHIDEAVVLRDITLEIPKVRKSRAGL